MKRRKLLVVAVLLLALVPEISLAACQANLKVTNKHSTTQYFKQLLYGCSGGMITSVGASGMIPSGKSQILKGIVLDALFDCNVLCKKYVFKIGYTDSAISPISDSSDSTTTAVTSSGQVVTVTLD